jgi:hypothetical protein
MGNSLSWLSPVLVAAGVSVFASESLAFTVLLDEFRIIRDGGPVFVDTFADGSPPPTAPPTLSGGPAAYGVFGTFVSGSETGGKLALNTADGAIRPNPIGTLFSNLAAMLLTNTDPTDPTTGLKSNHTFSVSGLFDIALPPNPLDNYFIFLSDQGPEHPLDDRVLLEVIRRFDGLIAAQLLQQDFGGGTQTLISQIIAPTVLPPGTDQIMLTLSRTNLANNLVTAQVQLFGGGVPTSALVTLPGFGTIFDGEGFVRPGFQASSRVSEAGTLALLIMGLSLLGWISRRPVR